MPRFFKDDELQQIISNFINQDGYFVTCFKLPKNPGDIVPISFTGIKSYNCVILQVSTRDEALRQIARAGYDPAWFSLELPYFYRAMLD